jgi:hypothetical protein
MKRGTHLAEHDENRLANPSRFGRVEPPIHKRWEVRLEERRSVVNCLLERPRQHAFERLPIRRPPHCQELIDSYVCAHPRDTAPCFG